MAFPEGLHLLFAILLCVIALVLADRLWRTWRERRMYQQRLNERLARYRAEQPRPTRPRPRA